MGSRAIKFGAWSFLSFVGLALVQTWPLPLHLSTHLTGLPGGDAGVYVWNTWVFRHQLVELGRWPFSTETVLPLDGDTNLSLHNYTVFADLLSLPLQPLIGVVAAFNVVYIINVALSGFGAFLLARRVTGRTTEAWIAGMIFACSPFLVARGASHFSLAAAAPLPFFLFFLDRAWRGMRMRDALAAGVTLAWAAFSDPYYAIYCVMLAAFFIVAHALVVAPHRDKARSGHWRVVVDVVIAALVCLIIGVNGLAGGDVEVGGFRIAMRTLYTPVLILTCLVIVRLLMALRPTISWRPLPMPARLVTFAAAGAIAAALLLLPELYAIVVLAAEGQLSTAPVLWRSSAPGVDVLAFLIPNPNHPLAPEWLRAWIAKRPGGFDENVVSLSFVGFGVIAAAWKWAGFRPARLWTAITVGFASLAVGPFIEIAGRHTFVPTPWTLLRYFPVVGEARMPQRFSVVVVLGFSVIVATALAALGRRFPARRRRILTTTGLLLAFELLPAPRPLFSAEIPAVYRIIADDPRPVRVLELPFGIRDGLSSLGNFSAASQFYQTQHGKPLLGGYLSRVPSDTKQYYRSVPVARALLVYSERRTPTAVQLDRARRSADDFLRSSNLGYVVLDRSRTTPELRAFAIEVLQLTKLAESGEIELYATPLAQDRAEMRPS
jgi:hypothetical protein